MSTESVRQDAEAAALKIIGENRGASLFTLVVLAYVQGQQAGIEWSRDLVKS